MTEEEKGNMNSYVFIKLKGLDIKKITKKQAKTKVSPHNFTGEMN